MASFSTTPAGINPNPVTAADHRRNWQLLAQWLVGAGAALDDNGGLNANLALTVALPAELLINGSHSISLTGYSLTLTVTNATESANTAWLAPNGTSGIPSFRQILAPDLSITGLASGRYLTTDGTNNSWAAISVPVTAAAAPLFLNGTTVTLSATSSMSFGAIVCAGSISATTALFSGAGTVTGNWLVGTNGTLTNTGIINFGGAATIGGNLTVTGGGTLTTAGAFTIAGSATMSGLDLTSMTAGSVLFASTGGVVSQANAYLFWDETNKRLGINAPSSLAFTRLSPNNMSANSTPSPYVASASSENASQLAWKAFNGTSDYWRAANVSYPQYLQLDFGASTTVSAYRITGFDDGYMPKNWHFDGSNDGSSWTVLDTITGAPTWTASEVRAYALGSTVSYRYYRITFTLSPGDSVIIRELEIGTGVVTVTPASKLHVVAGSASEIVSIFRGTTSQTGNLSEWQATDGTILAKVNNTGGATFAAMTISGTSSFTGNVTVGTAATITANGTGSHSIGSITHQQGTLTATQILDSALTAGRLLMAGTSGVIQNTTINATGSTLGLTSLLVNGNSLGTESTVTLGPVTLTTATPANVGSLSLAAGLWLVVGVIEFTATTASTLDFKSGVNTTSATFGGLGTYVNQPLIATGLTDAVDQVTPLWRFDFRTAGGNTPVYIIASSSFTLGTVVVNAFARAIAIG